VENESLTSLVADLFSIEGKPLLYVQQYDTSDNVATQISAQAKSWSKYQMSFWKGINYHPYNKNHPTK